MLFRSLLPEAVLTEMRLLLSDGSVYGGADAIIEIARRIWWGWPVFLFGRLPGGRSAMRAIYRRIAARRRCSSGACQMAPRIPKFRPPGFTLWWLDWVPMALLTSHALIVRNELPGWAFMWLMAWAIFFGCKFATWQRAWRPGPARRSAGHWVICSHGLGWMQRHF